MVGFDGHIVKLDSLLSLVSNIITILMEYTARFLLSHWIISLNLFKNPLKTKKLCMFCHILNWIIIFYNLIFP